MRILLITHKVVRGDGQGRVNCEIAHHCLARGHAVTLIADQVDQHLLESGARWVPAHPAVRKPALLREWAFAHRVDRLVRRMRKEFDVIVGNGYVLTEPHHVSLSHFVHGASGIATGPDRRTHGPRAAYRALYTRRNIKVEKASYAAANLVVAISAGVRQELLRIGVDEAKVRVVHNGVDLNEFRPGTEERSALGLPAGVPLGLFIGDLQTCRKNLDTVLRALVKVPRLQLAVVGALRHSPFPRIAAELGVADRVHFMDFRRDVPQIIRACDLLVFPSRYEPFGLVILEAMSSGLPVVTTRVCGAAELMNDDCGQVLDDPENEQALAEAMKKFANPEFRKPAGIAARKIAESHGWSRMAAKYLDIFEEAR